MKILQLTHRHFPSPGGVEVHVNNISNLLAQKGHEVIILSSNIAKDQPFIQKKYPSYYLEVGQGSLHIHRYNAYKVLDLKHNLGAIIPKMFTKALREEVDLIHAHAYGYWPTYVSMFKKILSRSSLVITPHSNPGSKDFGIIDIRKYPLKIANRIVALTKLEKTHLIRCGLDPRKICVIPNGVDLSKYKTRSLKRLMNTNIVLYVGRINCSHKGLDTLIKAIPDVVKTVKNVKFVFVGPDWGDRNYLECLASQLHILDHIKFTGYISEKEKLKYYEISNLFVLPSNLEPFGIVLLEAMAYGKPIVASDVGGIPDIVTNGENGLLIPPRNPSLLAKSIIFLLVNQNIAEKMGSFGKEIVKQFSWASVVNKLENLYFEANK